MATYELYLWDAQVDLSSEDWDHIISNEDRCDETYYIEVVRYRIYYAYHEKPQPSPNIEKFFSCLLDTLNKPEYAIYFENTLEWITKQQGFFKDSPRLVFQDEYTLANEPTSEFKRALYEAIKQSGLCAYDTRYGYLITADADNRLEMFNTIFHKFPALTVPTPRPAVTLDTIPENVTEMTNVILAFMQQHPIGRHFEVKEVYKYTDEKWEDNSIYFIRTLDHISHQFRIYISHRRRDDFYYYKEFTAELGSASYKFDFSSQYLTEQEIQQAKENKVVLDGIEIEVGEYGDLTFSMNLKDVKFYKDMMTNAQDKCLNHFKMNQFEFHLFKDFLTQIDQLLNIFGSLANIQDVADLIFHTKDILTEEAHNMLNGIPQKNMLAYNLLKIAI